MTKKTATTFQYEESIRELETLVGRLERDDLTLEDALACFERGVALIRACQKALADAEQKVKILLEKEDRSELADFAPDPNAPPTP
jgi:exodeoxyribonuclease VII small subunit